VFHSVFEFDELKNTNAKTLDEKVIVNKRSSLFPPQRSLQRPKKVLKRRRQIGRTFRLCGELSPEVAGADVRQESISVSVENLQRHSEPG
jgi:hypothetical protein